MQHKQISSTETLITFADFDERARFLIARKFNFTPGAGRYARWVSKAGAGDPQYQLELTPADARHVDNLQALHMRLNRYLT